MYSRVRYPNLSTQDTFGMGEVMGHGAVALRVVIGVAVVYSKVCCGS